MKITKLNNRNLGLLILLLGEAGVGKTTQVYTLPEDKTLFLNAEDGIRAIQSWEGDIIDIKCWNDCVALASIIGGVNTNISTTNVNLPYSKLYHEKICNENKELVECVAKYDYIFIDSITKYSFYCKQHAESIGLTGFKLWGFIGDNLVALFNQLRRSNKTIICTGGQQFTINEETQQKEYNYLLDGGVSKFNIKHIFDYVLSMVNGNDILPKQTKFEKENPNEVDPKRDAKYFVCRENNPMKFIAKERSGGYLGVYELANIADVIDKINSNCAKPDFFNKKKEEKQSCT